MRPQSDGGCASAVMVTLLTLSELDPFFLYVLLLTPVPLFSHFSDQLFFIILKF